MHGSKLNQEATTRYSQAFSAQILEDFFSKNDGINGQQIIGVTPIKQVNFFVLKVLFDQWQEETKKFRSPFFNYKNQEVNTALKSLVNTLSKNILIEKEDFRPLLEQAVYETLVLIFEPQKFYAQLVDSLGKNQELRSVSKYIKVFKPQFDALVKLTESKDGRDLSALIVEAFDSQPIDLQEKQSLVDEFETVLKLDVLEEEPKPAKTEEPSFPEISATEAFGESKPENINGHDAPNNDELNQQFEPVETPEPNSQPSSVNEQFVEQDIQTLNQKYETQSAEKTIADKHEEQGASSLAASININQRYMFLSDLFEGNEADYSKALETVDSNKSFDDSVEFLVQNYAKQYSWDMNSDEVKEFLKVIFKRFR